MAKVVGDKVLRRRFRALDKNAQGVILVAAAAAGAGVIRDGARERAPRDPVSDEHGADHIEIEVSKRSKSRVRFDIGYDKTKAFHLKFQETGTKFHAAQPHLRPALDEDRDRAVDAVGKVIRLGVEAARRA